MHHKPHCARPATLSDARRQGPTSWSTVNGATHLY